MKRPKIMVAFSPRNKNYFTTTKGECSKCGQPVRGAFMYVIRWGKYRSQEFIYCRGCYDRRILGETLTETKVVLATEVMPDDAIPYIPRPPALTSRNRSNEEVAVTNIDGEEVIDHTVYAGRPEGSWQGAQVGAPDMELLAEKDRELNLKAGLEAFDMIASSVPVDQKRPALPVRGDMDGDDNGARKLLDNDGGRAAARGVKGRAAVAAEAGDAQDVQRKARRGRRVPGAVLRARQDRHKKQDGRVARRRRQKNIKGAGKHG